MTPIFIGLNVFRSVPSRSSIYYHINNQIINTNVINCSRQTGSDTSPDSKVHGAKMGPIWGRQDPGEPHGGPMNLAIWELVTEDGFGLLCYSL